MLDRVPGAPQDHSALWSIIAARCEATWPLEACGVVIDGVLAETATRPSARDSFRLGPADALLLGRALRRGASVVLWHSHTMPDAPAGPSRRDAEAAAPAGVPLHPGLVHVVVDVRNGGRFAGARAFLWTEGRFEPAGAWRTGVSPAPRDARCADDGR